MALLKSSLLVGLVAWMAYTAYPNYQGWLALGPGGPPYNIIGYSFQAILQPISLRNMTSIDTLLDISKDDMYPDYPRERHILLPLAERKGDRPLVPSYVAPQRQTTDHSPATIVAQMNERLQEMTETVSDVYTKPSQLESPDYQALWAKEPYSHLKRIKGEFAHVHADGSSHVVLSPVDAQDVITLKWGQLHKLAGVLGILPPTYTLLYAPRNQDELETWTNIVEGAVLFNSGIFMSITETPLTDTHDDEL